MSISIQAIREAVIGEGLAIPTPFGDKPLIYADYTASGRSLEFIEAAIREQVLPVYANTHSEAAYTGRQIGALREQARAVIREAVGANEDYAVIFCGSGATAAINRLIDILGLRIPSALEDRHQLTARIPADQRPVVFIGPWEHHSNELPWRESIAELVTIGLTADGAVDLVELEDALGRFADRPLKIGSFSAASNVTGIHADVDGIARLLNGAGAISCWDYAAAAPYVGIDMRATDDTRRKHALFFSPHKFVGGPGTPGVLVVHRSSLKNRVPAVPGGGTVLYVTPDRHRFLDDPERREEGGTPAIIESIRAGLAVGLRQAVGTERIESLEAELVKRALSRWAGHPNIHVLGPLEAARLSIISFQILHRGRPLHYGLVTALLNDLFGIQARGGCSCAGPYGHHLLALSAAQSQQIEQAVASGHAVLRPGWCRLNFNYFIDETSFDYILSAVELIADQGWRLMTQYRFDREAAVWRHCDGFETPTPNLLALLTTSAPRLARYDGSLTGCLEMARDALAAARPEAVDIEDGVPTNLAQLRWYATQPGCEPDRPST